MDVYSKIEASTGWGSGQRVKKSPLELRGQLTNAAVQEEERKGKVFPGCKCLPGVLLTTVPQRTRGGRDRTMQLEEGGGNTRNDACLTILIDGEGIVQFEDEHWNKGGNEKGQPCEPRRR